MKKLLCLMCIGLFLFAAEFGRVQGRVINAETGEPLIGADVIVEGTELGAATDENGEYTVLFVPVGTHRVVTSYISYDAFTYTNVVVNADQTTLLNFQLEPTVIEVGEVVVEAERPMVVISSVSTDRAVTSQEIDRLPVTTINQVITLQAGVVESDLGTHLRGGRTDEITYFVNGIVTKVPNEGWQSMIVNPSGVEEVTVVSGGFDAEYGDALSGVINVVTKEGGTKHSGTVRWLTDEIFVDSKTINYGYNLYDFSLGGPLGSRRFRYFISGELMLNDAWEEALYMVPSPRMDYRGQGRLSYLLPSAKGKVTVSGLLERRQWVNWRSQQYKYFDQIFSSRIKNWMAGATFNYMLTEKTLAEFKLGATHFDRFFGNRDYVWEEENDRQWYDDYRFHAEHLVGNYLLNDSLPVKDIIVDSVMQYHTEFQNRGFYALRNSPWGVEGLFYTYGDFRTWSYWWNNDYQARVDLTHSVGKVHEFKTGFDFIQYEMKYYNNNLPWVTNPFWDYYDYSPFKLAYYIQDKMDFEGLITRLGLRLDYFDPKAFTFANPNDFEDSTLAYADQSLYVSPRLGFSLPVTDRMKFRFNYGHYFQLPALGDMYTTTDTAVVRLALSRGNAILGNILMKPQRTVQYEVGVEQQLTDVLALGFTAYFKDIYDLSTIRQVDALPISYFQYFNVDYGNVKGFEFNFQKRMSNMWALGLSYTLQFAKGTSAYAYEWYQDHYQYQIEPPVADYWLDFDQRHSVNVNFDLAFPRDYFFVPFQEFTNSFVVSYNSGQPYTPEDLDGNKIGDENSARMPGYWNVDWSFARRFTVAGANVTVSGLIYNLFNTEQVVNVYVTTGDPRDHGDPEPNLGQFTYIPYTSDRYSPQADYNHDGLLTPVEMKAEYIAARNDYYIDPEDNFNGPFRMRLGIALGF